MMPGPAIAIAAVALVLAFDVFCLITLVLSRVRQLPKWGWAVII